MSKPYATVKQSEWNKMPRKTRDALAEMCKCVAKMTPEQLKRAARKSKP